MKVDWKDGALIRAHQELLERFRRSMNLVGPGPIEEHYEDAALALASLKPAGRWADLGTGAGFPGIPFAGLFPDVALDLVESRAKRCWFLDQVLAEAGRADLRVCRQRHETLEGGYDGVLSRALHAPERMVDVAKRLVRPGGTLVLFLQDDAVIPDGGEVFHVERYAVGGKARKAAYVRIG